MKFFWSQQTLHKLPKFVMMKLLFCYLFVLQILHGFLLLLVSAAIDHNAADGQADESRYQLIIICCTRTKQIVTLFWQAIFKNAGILAAACGSALLTDYEFAW